MSNQISNSNFYPQNRELKASSVTYHADLIDSGYKDTNANSFFNSKLQTNSGFNKTAFTSQSQMKVAPTPTIGTKYSGNQFRKLHTMYNARNTKSVCGGMSEVTAGIIFIYKKQIIIQKNSTMIQFHPQILSALDFLTSSRITWCISIITFMII